VGDNITTDHIMPAGSKILPYRSNIPYLSQFCFAVCDKEFARRCQENGSGVVVGGSNYGQGSSREHAALVPLSLGVRAVIVKSFARIHSANLVNAGILPLVFADERDYDGVDQMDELELGNLRGAVSSGAEVTVFNRTKNASFQARIPLSERQREIVLAGGLLNYTREHAGKE
jgi:aconitate hydratase